MPEISPESQSNPNQIQGWPILIACSHAAVFKQPVSGKLGGCTLINPPRRKIWVGTARESEQQITFSRLVNAVYPKRRIHNSPIWSEKLISWNIMNASINKVLINIYTLRPIILQKLRTSEKKSYARSQQPTTSIMNSPTLLQYWAVIWVPYNK